MNNALNSWLLDAGTWIAFALWLACVAYGFFMVLVPGATLRASAGLDRRYSSRKALRPLEIPRTSEQFFYRYHRLAGGVLLISVFAFFVVYLLDFPRDTVLSKIAGVWGRPMAGIVLESLEAFFVGANALIGVFAVIMILRPSLLKPLEARANRWISTRKALRRVEEERRPLDNLVQRFPRMTGFLVLLASGYIAAGILVAL